MQTYLIKAGEFQFHATFAPNGLRKIELAQGKGGTQKSEEPYATWVKLTASALESVLSGRTPKKLPPLSLEGTEFQEKVWIELKKIPLGQTISYSELAARCGRARAARAAGSACGRNPVPLLIPCHRVVGSAGALGGFAWGVDWKQWLLAMEQNSSNKRSSK